MPARPLVPEAHDAHAEDMEKADAQDNQGNNDLRKCKLNHGSLLLTVARRAEWGTADHPIQQHCRSFFGGKPKPEKRWTYYCQHPSLLSYCGYRGRVGRTSLRISLLSTPHAFAPDSFSETPAAVSTSCWVRTMRLVSTLCDLWTLCGSRGSLRRVGVFGFQRTVLNFGHRVTRGYSKCQAFF